jgi:hypothetical protein
MSLGIKINKQNISSIFVIIDDGDKRKEAIQTLSANNQKIDKMNTSLNYDSVFCCLMFDPAAEDWFIGVGQHDQVEITLQQLDEVLNNGEVVVTNPTFGLFKEPKEKQYKLHRPCLWFCKGDTVTTSEFNRYFKQDAIEQLLQYGFIELIQPQTT